MYKWIQTTARNFEESSSKLSVTGIKIFTVSFIIAVFSFVEVATINTGYGQLGVKLGVFGGMFGFFMAFVGKIEKHLESKELESGLESNPYDENHKKPWE